MPAEIARTSRAVNLAAHVGAIDGTGHKDPRAVARVGGTVLAAEPSRVGRADPAEPTPNDGVGRPDGPVAMRGTNGADGTHRGRPPIRNWPSTRM
jgi:hypothetical protein